MGKGATKALHYGKKSYRFRKYNTTDAMIATYSTRHKFFILEAHNTDRTGRIVMSYGKKNHIVFENTIQATRPLKDDLRENIFTVS